MQSWLVNGVVRSCVFVDDVCAVKGSWKMVVNGSLYH